MSLYDNEAKAALAQIAKKDKITILAIESSCDETAAAVLSNRDVLSNIIASQVDIHKRFGGVVPEIASRNHSLAVKNVVEQAVEQSGLQLCDIDCIAVTYGAGLLGALLVGVSYAKALAYALKKPLIAVNHIKGHIAVNYVASKDLKPPYVGLIASGGHTAILKVKDYLDFEVLGETQDDAAGEAFDKVARVLGLPYPGGPCIEKLAKEGVANIKLPIPLKKQLGYDFSYSGLKTAVINYVNSAKQRGDNICAADIAASFQDVATDMMVDNAVRAAIDTKIDTIVVAGGVGANTQLRQKLEEKAEKFNIKVFYPPVSLCTDNAVMIAAAAYFMIKSGKSSQTLALEASANVALCD